MCRGGKTDSNKKKKPTIYAIDFFCGGGGVTKGLADAGINVLAGIDYDNVFKKTYEYNNPRVTFINEDIRKITPNIINNIILKGKKSFLLFAGCAPCQPFSDLVGKKSDGRIDKRKYSLISFGNLIEKIKPDFVFTENVPGIVTKYNGKIWSMFISKLENTGYFYKYDIIDAKSYGVPQTRKRIILIASRLGNIELPRYTHGTNLLKYNTVRLTISKYPRLKASEEDKNIPNHRAASLSPINYKRLASTPINGGSRIQWRKNLWLKCHINKKGHLDVYGRMKWDYPAPTLTCRCNSISNGRYGHPRQNRAISLREAAALQTFPDDYIFFGPSYNSIAKQIGNAVPVLLAKKIGQQIIQSAEAAICG